MISQQQNLKKNKYNWQVLTEPLVKTLRKNEIFHHTRRRGLTAVTCLKCA